MRLVAAVLAVLAAAPATARSVGDGRATTDPRDVGAFSAISLRTDADVRVRVGPQRAVRVTIDGNLQPLLRTEVRDGVLVISSDEALRPRTAARVEVDTPELRRFGLEGAGDVTVAGGSGPVDLAIEGSGDLRWQGEATALRASIEGSGDLWLDGRAAELFVSVEGSGDVDASRLTAKDAEVSVEGSGDVELNLAGGKLSAAVAGSGDIHWRGAVSVERSSVSGAGEISKRE